MKLLLKIWLLLSLLSIAAFAETLTGVATNGTTNKPAAGDDVILIKLGEGMQEASRAKTDARGRFSLNLDDPGPHLVRVVHQGVTYHRMAPPGSTSVEVQVFDVGKKVPGVNVTADVMRFQAQDGQLQGIRLFAIDNKSDPPRTQMTEPGFEFYLPEGAVVDSSEAQSGNAQPLNLAPVPQDDKNKYAFMFPLRPGATQFQVVFHLPYSGQLSIDPKPLYPAQHFVVMLPRTMQFTASSGSNFETRQNPREPDSTVEVASNTASGQMLAFKVSGTGLLGGSEAPGGEAQSEGGAPRPGGGIGPPIDAPHPLQKSMWYILGVFAVVMTAGAFFAVRRPVGPAQPASGAGPGGSSGSMLLEALKEELFQLEVEHKQGKITQAEYDKAKAALDQTLERAVKRSVQK